MVFELEESDLAAIDTLSALPECRLELAVARRALGCEGAEDEVIAAGEVEGKVLCRWSGRDGVSFMLDSSGVGLSPQLTADSLRRRAISRSHVDERRSDSLSRAEALCEQHRLLHSHFVAHALL